MRPSLRGFLPEQRPVERHGSFQVPHRQSHVDAAVRLKLYGRFMNHGSLQVVFSFVSADSQPFPTIQTRSEQKGRRKAVLPHKIFVLAVTIYTGANKCPSM